MVALAKVLLAAVTVPGPGATVDLAAMSRSITMQVVPGGASPDLACQVQLQGSLDGTNWFGMGQVTGQNQLSVDEDTVQYVRANVLKIASGNITANLAFTAG
jgi:hypothetical protein